MLYGYQVVMETEKKMYDKWKNAQEKRGWSVQQ